MTTQQWIALGISVFSYGLIISEKVSRTIASIFGAILAFLFILTPQDLLHYENWETILFVFGMMAVIETKSLSVLFTLDRAFPRLHFTKKASLKSQG